jgi:hypothetical protein
MTSTYLRKSLSLFAAAIWAAGCMEAPTSATPTSPVPAATSITVSQPTSTGRPSTATSTMMPTRPVTPTGTLGPTPLPSPTLPAEAHLVSRCLSVAPTFQAGQGYSGVVVLASRSTGDDPHRGEVYFYDISAGTTITVENAGPRGVVSPDGKLLASISVVTNARGHVVSKQLAIRDVSGQLVKLIPWEPDWYELLGWVENQSVVIHQSKPNHSMQADTFLVLNPQTSVRKTLGRRFPDFADSDFVNAFWDGWYEVQYDPTLTRVTYPRPVSGNNRLVTYGLWDVSKQKLITSLDKIYIEPVPFGSLAYRPVWTTDGSAFVFLGFTLDAGRDLFRVSRDGQVEQLTHLAKIRKIQSSNLSWSPNGRYVAMYLNHYGVQEDQAHVAVLDTTTLNLTDYCIGVNYGQGLFPPAAIWSPDSNQFLVTEIGITNPTRVILVDIAKGQAAQIAQDVEPVGWMVN